MNCARTLGILHSVESNQLAVLNTVDQEEASRPTTTRAHKLVTCSGGFEISILAVLGYKTQQWQTRIEVPTYEIIFVIYI